MQTSSSSPTGLDASGGHSSAVPVVDETEGLIYISTPQLLLAVIPLLGVAVVSWRLSFGLETQVVVGCTRTFVQLSVLGFILHPIFIWGHDRWYVVVGYALCMMVLASQQACSTTKYHFDGIHLVAFVTIAVITFLVALFAFLVILKTEPPWDPQYVIPILGMLLGNTVNGISLALNAILTAFAERYAEIELYLSFGANSLEATSRLLREAVSVATNPQLNSMAVIGVISIPGMMTGQILGGSPVKEAARYQILIMYLIATNAFVSIFVVFGIALRVGFDTRNMLRNDRFYKKDGTGPWARLRRWTGMGATHHTNNYSSHLTGIRSIDGESQPLRDVERKHGLRFEHLDGTPSVTAGTSPKLLEVLDIARSFRVLRNGGQIKSTLFEDVSFDVGPGRILMVRGASGAGKSQLLRCIAALSETEKGDIRLAGKSRSSSDFSNFAEWRRRVRYISQARIDIPGTPRDFIERIVSFRSWQQTKVTAEDMSKDTVEFITAWDLKSDVLDSPWSTLSGGEAQRVLLALALASRPAIVLLDESTSALDYETKARVEKSCVEFIKQKKLGALWVTHDEEQTERLALLTTNSGGGAG